MSKLEKVIYDIGKLKERLRCLEQKRDKLLCMAEVDGNLRKTTEKILKEVKQKNLYLIITGGRHWLCSNQIEGRLYRRLEQDEVDAIKPFIKDFRR